MVKSADIQPNVCADLTAIIPDNQATSQEIDLQGTSLCGLFMPPTFTGTSIKFLAAHVTGGAYVPVQDGSGFDYSVIVSGGKYIPIPDINAFVGVRFLKLVSSVTEAAARSIVIAAKPL